ncbi:MAG TPA: glycosyltransferase family 39 protein, partial [Polyangiaceae bacterium]
MGDQAASDDSAHGRARATWLGLFALAVALLSLVGPIASSGIWDPPEHTVAELSRRIAVNLLGGRGLNVEGALNTVPTRGDLGRGELPFTSVALGFRLFGLHDWAGRLPLAVWGLLGAGAVYLLVRRLADRTSAAYAVLVLVTMPLYFLHARTMLGEIVIMAGVAGAVTGFGLCLFDARASAALRGLDFCLGLLGLSAGFLTRGLLLGVAVPVLAVGLTWLTLRAARALSADRVRDAIGLVLLCAGAVCLAVGVRALAVAMPEQLSLLLGSVVNRPRALPTFDALIAQLGPGLFPWSVLVPIALGYMLRTPQAVEPEAHEGHVALRALTLITPALGLWAYGISAPVVGVLPFAEVGALAIAVALLVRDLERGAPASRAVPMVMVALLVLLLEDFKNFPERALSAFCVSDAHFPDSFRETSGLILKGGSAVFAVVLFFALEERRSGPPKLRREDYLSWPRTLRELWGGNLQFTLLVVEAALLGASLLGFLGTRIPRLGHMMSMSSAARTQALWTAVGLPALVVSPLLVTAARDVFRFVFAAGRARQASDQAPRGRATLAVGVLFGAVLSFVYYPALAAQISPKKVFDAYRHYARAGEPLGLVGASSGAASYYAGRSVPAFDTPTHAFDWLVAGKERRWLVLRSADFGIVNSLYRGHASPPRNLPVIDARSSEILLVSNRLDGERDQNPLNDSVLNQAPKPSHVLDADLENKLDVLGWDVLDENDAPVSAVE